LINYIFYFFAGTIAGSFFYTLAERYSNGSMKENVFRALFSRSGCPACARNIPVIYLVPLFGFILSRGKCSFCGKRIALIYPLIEVLYGVLAILVARYQGTDIQSVFVYLIAAVSVTIAIVDIKTMTIPLSLIIAFFVLSIYPVLMRNNFADSLYGFIFLTLFFLIIMFIFPGAFGGGDLKLYGAAGLLLGLEMSVVLLEVSLISGAVFGIIWGLTNGRNFRIRIPFAPFIAAGIIITLLFGNTIVLFYYRNIYTF